MQNRGTPPVRFMRQAPDHRVTRNTLAPAAATPPILTSNAACQHCVVWLNALTRHLQPQVIQARERAQVGAIKGSIGHVEVFQMDGVGISIIERPRPLPGHDTPNPTQQHLHPQMRRASKGAQTSTRLPNDATPSRPALYATPGTNPCATCPLHSCAHFHAATPTP